MDLPELRIAHERFMTLVAELRPELHRYCSRMMGSIVEGEDVVQDALTRAYFELSQLREMPALRSWIFRIAHHQAVDHLRRRHRWELEEANEDTLDEDPLERAETLQLALHRFTALPPAQRACVIFKDVLGLTLAEIAGTLDMTVPAVKASLRRGRVNLEQPAALQHGEFSPELLRYAERFNARDWDAVRAMLSADVKLNVVGKETRTGLETVGHYFTNYGKASGWSLTPAWLDGREVLQTERAFIALHVHAGEIVQITDFRYAPWVMADASFEVPRSSSPSSSH